MNKLLKITALCIVSFVLIIIQTTLLSPGSQSYLYPDLNLIFIIFLAIRSYFPGAVFVVLLNGYLMDVMSGYTIGVHTVSRLVTYLALKNSADKVNYEHTSLQLLAYFTGTVLTWIVVWGIFKTKFSYEPVITLELVVNQATINCITGILITYFFDRSYAKLQE